MKSSIFFVSLALAFGAHAASDPRFRIVEIPTLAAGSLSSFVTRVNDRQQSVGWSVLSDSGRVSGFIANGPQVQALGDLGGGWVERIALNGQGVVVGAARDRRNDLHAFMVQDGVLVDLNGNRRNEASGAEAVNDPGQVVGWATYAGVTGMRASVFTPAGPVSIGSLDNDPLSSAWSIANDIDASGRIVGQSRLNSSNSESRAFLYQDGQMQNIGNWQGSLGSWATAINDNGWVTGTLDMGGLGLHAFVYDGTRLVNLGTLTGLQGTAEAMDINNRGQIVGLGYVDGRGTGFLYDNGAMLNLNDLVDPLDGFYIAGAQSINNNGDIAAQACRVGFAVCKPVLLVPIPAIPEPAPAVLLALGIGALTGWRRRQVKAA